MKKLNVGFEGTTDTTGYGSLTVGSRHLTESGRGSDRRIYSYCSKVSFNFK